jgi:hypothetical protein
VVGDSPPYEFYAEFPTFYDAINVEWRMNTFFMDFIYDVGRCVGWVELSVTHHKMRQAL